MKKGKSKKRSVKRAPVKKKQQASNDLHKRKYFDFLGFGIVIIIGILIYANSFGSAFHLDDVISITENAKIRNLFDLETLWNHSPSRFIPYYTFALNYHFGELNVWGYHLGNLLVHLINSCLVYWLTSMIFSLPVFQDKMISKDRKLIALFSALLFVTHPLATQSVTYIVQRMASMVTLFYLLSIALYVKARIRNSVNLVTFLLYFGTLISALLATLSKENFVTLPIAIILVEVFFFHKKRISINFKDFKVIIFIVVFLGIILSFPLTVSSSIFNPIVVNEHNQTVSLTPVNYLFTQFSVIIKYIQLLILPINLNLDYDYKISTSFFELRTIISFIFLLGLFAIAGFLFKKNRLISFGIFWFFLTISVESSIIPLRDVIFEHRTYLPSFGFFLILSYGLYHLLWKKHKLAAIAICMIIIGSFASLTVQRNKVWVDEVSLWSDVVSKSPKKARGFINRGKEYWKLNQKKAAFADFSQAIELHNTSAEAFNNRGLFFADQGQTKKALKDYNTAIENNPNFGSAFANRGLAYAALGQPEKALADYNKAIEIHPNNARAYTNRGITLASLKEYDKAIIDYTLAIQYIPEFAAAYNNRGVALLNLKKWEEAIQDFTKAIEFDPNYANAYSNRGLVNANLKEWDKVVADISMAIRFNPNDAVAYNTRGVALGNLGQWDKALLDFTRATELNPRNQSAVTNRQIARNKLNAPGGN